MKTNTDQFQLVDTILRSESKLHQKKNNENNPTAHSPFTTLAKKSDIFFAPKPFFCRKNSPCQVADQAFGEVFKGTWEAAQWTRWCRIAWQMAWDAGPFLTRKKVSCRCFLVEKTESPFFCSFSNSPLVVGKPWLMCSHAFFEGVNFRIPL